MASTEVGGGTPSGAPNARAHDGSNVRATFHQLASSVNTIQPLLSTSRIQTSPLHADPRNGGEGYSAQYEKTKDCLRAQARGDSSHDGGFLPSCIRPQQLAEFCNPSNQTA